MQDDAKQLEARAITFETTTADELKKAVARDEKLET